jgi:hypothetical protein
VIRVAMLALVFAAAALAASLAIDLAFSDAAFSKYRIALHGASFTMTFLGAVMGFMPLPSRRAPLPLAALMGAGFGVLAHVAVAAAVRIGAFAAIALALVLGSMLVAWLGGRFLAKAE